MNHKITVKFKCGHKAEFERISGGVSDPSNCNCEACQPWDGEVSKDQDCLQCLLEKTQGFTVPNRVWWRACDVVPV